MKKIKRTEIIIEREQALVIRRLEQRPAAWCAGCGRGARMVTADEAAAIAGVSPQAIVQQVEAGKLHGAATPDGLLLICVASLLPVKG